MSKELQSFFRRFENDIENQIKEEITRGMAEEYKNILDKVVKLERKDEINKYGYITQPKGLVSLRDVINAIQDSDKTRQMALEIEKANEEEKQIRRERYKEIYERLYKDNPEFKAKRKAYYQENREVYLERQRKYRANNPEKIAAYREANKDHIQELNHNLYMKKKKETLDQMSGEVK